MLRHWSAWSGPPGRLFCKSNRRTLSGGPPRSSFLRLPPQRSPSASSTRAPRPSLLRRRATSASGRHFIFKKRPLSALSSVRSFILSAAEGFDSPLRMVAPWPTLLTEREKKNGEDRDGEGGRRREKRSRDPRSYASNEDTVLNESRESLIHPREHHHRHKAARNRLDDSWLNARN